MSPDNEENTKTVTPKNKTEAIFRPTDFFVKPEDIELNDILTLREKEQALWTWKTDLALEEIALEENMKGADIRDDIVSAVDNALRRVHQKLKDGNVEHPSPSKFGSF